MNTSPLSRLENVNSSNKGNPNLNELSKFFLESPYPAAPKPYRDSINQKKNLDNFFQGKKEVYTLTNYSKKAKGRVNLNQFIVPKGQREVSDKSINNTNNIKSERLPKPYFKVFINKKAPLPKEKTSREYTRISSFIDHAKNQLIMKRNARQNRYHHLSLSTEDKAKYTNTKCSTQATSTSMTTNLPEFNNVEQSYKSIEQFLRKVDEKSMKNVDLINYLSKPHLLTLMRKDSNDTRFIFMLSPSKVYKDLGIRNYDINFLHPESREIFYTFNILNVNYCERTKNKKNVFKIYLENPERETLYIFTGNEKEADIFARGMSTLSLMCKCKAYSKAKGLKGN